ncbi:MAG TPA: nitrile hydratase accessory protein [Steroidobacteraceae bacterium]|nr:nitrile hydratase accessory protein [Steroidobacteraceae bacterium]
MKRPEGVPSPAALAELPALPSDAAGPVFAEPWQASAFALTVSLSHQGHFSWKEWAATLGEELQASAARGEPDDGSHYYHCWLAALERLVVGKGLSESAELLDCRQAWAEAYRRTPHGKPVELANAAKVPQR